MDPSTASSAPNHVPTAPPSATPHQDGDSDTDLSSLTREIEQLSQQTSNILESLQVCVHSTSEASLLLSRIATNQIEVLAASSENLASQVNYVLDLFSLLQLKIAQIGFHLTQLPAFEHELDTILKYLPSLEQRVQAAVTGIRTNTMKFTPPSAETTRQWEARQAAHYARVNASPPTSP